MLTWSLCVCGQHKVGRTCSLQRLGGNINDVVLCTLQQGARHTRSELVAYMRLERECAARACCRT